MADFDNEELEKQFNEVLNDYEEKFGEQLLYPLDLPMPSLEEWIKELRKCIAENTPYVYPEYNLPEGCIS